MEVVELQGVENMCRLCLSTDEPKSSIFEIEDSPVSLAAKIQACLSIQVSVTDRLSTLICAECIKNVNQWHNYKESCLRSQDKLHQWLENHLQSNPTVVTIKDEPVDIDFYEDNVEIISESNDSDLHETNHVSPINNASCEHVEELTDEEVENVQGGKELETGSAQPELSKDIEKDTSHTDKQLCSVPIKTEPEDDYDTDCTIEIESVTGSELLLNPLTQKDDTIMEADSTQKSNANASANKKKIKRGPHTHFRGMRVFKQKCVHCQINLHSKYSYTKHMERFHSQEQGGNTDGNQSQDEEELIEDLEDELVSMEKDAPLTQVQQSIISQLKTFSCYSCQQSFSDRRSTLAHIRQHMPDLRPYTCIACLTEFPDRSMYKLHCGASFECAMKIALVVPKHGEEKYFTCNMCLRPMQNRKELLSHLSRHSDKQYEELISPTRSPPKLKPMAPLPQPKNTSVQKLPVGNIPGPYKNGDPAHNHVCDLCGMIYRYKPNMFKHRELCMRLLPEVRTSYRCIHCGMTFLVFKKFHTHITIDHKKKEFTCAQCNAKFRSPSDFVTHHESHRATRNDKEVSEKKTDPLKSPQSSSTSVDDWNKFESEMNSSTTKSSGQYSCALCSQDFATRAELSEHRNLHLKVKIYSCVICRSMFSSAGALEVHMKDHGIEDPNERSANSSWVEYRSLDEDSQDMNTSMMNTSATSDPGVHKNKCDMCEKTFSNYANLRRHKRNVHKNGKFCFTCSECSRTFSTKEIYTRHMQIEHKLTKTTHQCPVCPKSFVFLANLNLHFQTAHGEKSHGGQKCDICGKVFSEEASLKIHKGWHNRANSRLSTRFIVNNDGKNAKPTMSVKQDPPLEAPSERPARARKSFPNPPPAKMDGNFQCQVCDDKFSDVTELRKHLWDVHCARNKPEKSFSGNDLQCELCTNVFPDQETLNIHTQWHKANPILSDIQKTSFPCEICGKLYSSKKVLSKHKKLHKVTTVASMKLQSLTRKPMTNQYLCTICRKVFSSNQSLQRHKYSFHNDMCIPRPQQLYSPTRRVSNEEPRTKKIKIEVEDNPPRSPYSGEAQNVGKKPVMCHVCKKFFPNMSVLYKHKQLMHKPRVGKPATKIVTNECIPIFSANGKLSCNVCYKEFSGLPNLRQHFSLKHKNNPKYTCHIETCKMVFPSPVTLKNHELSHTNMIFSCNMCDRHVFSKPAMSKHMLSEHNRMYDAETNKSGHRETDLTTYVVRGAVGATCPRCKIKYPNNRAMKIHYFKFHETAD